MIERFRGWWGMRSLREQRMLLVMAAMIGITFAWLLILRPLDNALADARARHGRAVLALADAGAQADAIRAYRGGGVPHLPEPIEAYIPRKATEAGFTVARTDPQSPGQVNIAIDAVRAQAFFPWVAQMERNDPLVVEKLVAKPNADATLAVQVSFRLRGR